jgi:hypothetical protein
MPRYVMKHIRLRQVVELRAIANGNGRGEISIPEAIEKEGM